MNPKPAGYQLPLGRMRGMTLIEMMVALALGLIVVAAVGYIYISGLQSYRTQETMARLQEGGRFAFEILARNIRMAGSDACGASSRANVVVGTDWYLNLYNAPLIGYENGSGLPTDIVGELANRDAITIIQADNSAAYTITNHNPSSAQFDLSAPSDLKEGEVLVVCSSDGTHSAVFQMSGPNSATPSNVVHNTGVSGISPGNCSKKLGTPVPSTCTASTPASEGTEYTFPNGSRIMRLSSMTYFIRNNPAGVPSLYRQKLSLSGSSIATTAEELVEGVENMQIEYGVDTDTTDDATDKGLKVEQYVNASAVTDWSRVVSVKISLLMRTVEDNAADAPQTYRYPTPSSSAQTATDRRIRKVVSHVVRVRNR